ncbi:hypothetical protein C0585_05485 [Candidatus Woesearchaeota archaeon]|nr:MAG: hypothetical protein C0585_05485 [Candidatus Woesearchaeota archaeon]
MMRAKRIFEDFLLFALIILNVLDFVEVLSEDLDFVKKMISWTMMIYLLYHLGFTKILLGYKDKPMDIGLVFAYTLFIIKDLFFYISTASEFHIFEGLTRFLMIHEPFLSYWSFNIAAILIFMISIRIAFNKKIQEKSLLGAIRTYDYQKIIRFVMVFLALSFIAYFIFMMVFQWFTIVIDAPLVMIAIVYYFFASRRFHGVDDVLHKIANFGENILEKFIELFHRKETLPLAFASLLILHLLSDFFVFVVPSIIAIKDSLYHNVLQGSSNEPLISMFLKDMKGLDIFSIINLSTIYLSNIILIISIFLIPLIIIKDLYTKSRIRFSNIFDSILLSSFAIYFLFPIYKFVSIKNIATGISGVNILTLPIKKGFLFDYSIYIFLAIFLSIYALSKLFKKIDITTITLTFMLIPLFNYINKYFDSTVYYYSNYIKTILHIDLIFIVMFLFIFLFWIVMFYWPSIILLTYEIFRLNHIHLLPDKIDKDKMHKLATIIIGLIILYLMTYYLSSALYILEVPHIEFIYVLVIAIFVLMMPKINESFEKIDYGFNKKNILFFPLTMILGSLLSFGPIYFREILRFETNSVFTLTIFLIFVAFNEEIIYRHYLLDFLEKIYSFKSALIIQAIIFACMHFPYMNIRNFFSLAIFGVIVGLIRKKRGLFNSMIAHFVTNFILYYYFLFILRV